MAYQKLTNEGYYKGTQTFLGIGNANSVVIKTNGTVTDNVTVVLDNTTGLSVGMLVTGAGLNPPTIYKIAEITNTTTIKLDNKATIGTTVDLTFVPIISTDFTLKTSNFDPLPTEKGEFSVYINQTLVSELNYTYSHPTLSFTPTMANVDIQEMTTGAPLSGYTISVELAAYDREYGSYQNIKLKDIINNFTTAYIGQNKVVQKASRSDIAFHAQRAVQELNYDTLTSYKSQEIEIPPSLTVPIPHDYVNYTKIAWIDGRGLEYTLFPVRKTGNHTALLQDSDYNYIIDTSGNVTLAETSEAWDKYKSSSDGTTKTEKDYLEERGINNAGGRYGLTPEFTQDIGFFFIDQVRGRIHFSSNVTGKIVVLRYISDGLDDEGNILVHKFAEEAIYKYILYAILSTRMNVPDYVVRRFKKERFAEIRKAKLRLSNLKSEELTQIMRGKSKVIKS